MSNQDSTSSVSSFDDELNLDKTLIEIQTVINQNCSINEVQTAIDECLELITNCEALSKKRKWLVRCLIELRYKLLEYEASSSSQEYKSFIVSSGHHFYLQSENALKNLRCNHCQGIIWGFFQYWYKCSDCGFCCHTSFDELNKTVICPHTILTESGQFELEICPEIGISTQNYICAKCNVIFDYIDLIKNETRLCDYDGLYYCSKCHQNDTYLIPARIVHNWDLELYPVSHKTGQFLKLLKNRPVLNLEKLNPKLFDFIDDLKMIKELRKKLMSIKLYLTTCKNAQEEQLLKNINERVHLMESTGIFALNDIFDIKNCSLIPFLQKLINLFVNHIKVTCEICKQRGFFCEICRLNKELFRFDEDIVVCNECNWIYHKTCYQKRNELCLKCVRNKKRILGDD